MKAMVIGRNTKKIDMRIKDESIEQVVSFKYFGCNISSNMNCCQEVKQKIAMAKEALTGKEAFSADLGKRTKEEASEVLFVECSYVWCRNLDITTEWANNWKHLRCGYGACKMDRRNKKCSGTVKSGRRKNYDETDKEEEKKLAGPLAKKELPAEGCSRRYGKWEESLMQKNISDDRQHYDKLTL